MMATVLALVAERCAIDPATLRSNSHCRHAVAARALACYLGVVQHGLTPTAVAVELGISRRSVTRAMERAQQLAGLALDVAEQLR